MKYCTQCGTQNADENKFCQACGKAFQMVVTPQPAAAVPAGMTSTPLAREVLKQALGKVLFLVATILFSAATFFQFLYLFEQSNGAEQFFSDFSSGFQTMSVGTVASFDLSGLILIVPYGLLCAGLWVLFAQGRKAEADTIGTSGVQLVKVGTIIHMSIVCGLLALVVIILLIGQMVALFDYSYGDALILIPIVFLLIAPVTVFLVLTYVKVLQLLHATRRIITDGVTDFKVSQFLIVMCYVLSATYIIDALSSLGSSFLGFLGSGCEAAFLIVIAICLTKYKKELAMLQTYLSQAGTQEGQI